MFRFAQHDKWSEFNGYLHRAKKTLGANEISRIPLARFAAAGLGNGNRYHDRAGGTDGVSASFRAGPRIAVSLASTRLVRHRSEQIASHVSSLLKLHLVGP